MAELTRVLLVDDEHLMRAGLRLILGGAGDLEVVGEASDGAEALQQARDLAPDVVLMDIRMPVCDGIEATRLLRGAPDPPRVIMLTAFDTDDFVVDALEAGAEGFLLKDTPPADLVTAVRRAAIGTMPFSPEALRRLVGLATGSGRRRRSPGTLGVLSSRERQIALLVADGRSNTQIATALGVTVPTVKTHLGRMFDKLGLENRVQLAILALDER